MKKTICLIALLTLFAACQPSAAQIEKAIQQTQAVTDQTATAQAQIMQDQISTQAAYQTATAVSLNAIATLSAYCGKPQVDQSISEMKEILGRFSDAFELAANTSRISLSPIVSDMQKIARELNDLTVPVCLDEAKTALLQSMSSSIDGYLAFMAEESDETVTSYFDDGTKYLRSYSDKTSVISACAPDCDD